MNHTLFCCILYLTVSKSSVFVMSSLHTITQLSWIQHDSFSREWRRSWDVHSNFAWKTFGHENLHLMNKSVNTTHYYIHSNPKLTKEYGLLHRYILTLAASMAWRTALRLSDDKWQTSVKAACESTKTVAKSCWICVGMSSSAGFKSCSATSKSEVKMPGNAASCASKD